ncbi:hypothetical protein AAG570_013354 [Ranatra chinensis]|uniref:FHA domain-containing protein n=1 Tax=Ranatra chinensis TaxID=642074 RepID=A0ABD0YBW8_9HEMI
MDVGCGFLTQYEEFDVQMNLVSASFNGTYVGDTKVLPMRELGLINGDVIGLGAEASEPHCNYIYRLEFVPNIQHEENVGPSDSVHPSNDNYERSKTARDQLETIVAVTKEGAGCPTSDHTTVPRKSDPAEKSVDADDIGQEGWLKTAHLEASDTAKKRIATSPPPVPVKLPRRSDQGDKSINVSKTSITEEVSLRNRSSIDNGETMCVYSNEVVDDKLMNTNRVQNTKEDPVIIDISDPGLNPLKYVNMQRGTGIRENDNSIISNVSLMNSSIFSQAAEDVIEIGDSDDEFPCSQLFDSKEEPEELNRIKQEVKNDDSDVEIIEEECSFFEEHFSQNFRETSTPYKDCKVNISVKKEDCSEYVNNIKCSNTLNINPVVETVVIDDGLTPVNEADDVFPSVEAIVGTVEDAVNAISPLDSAVEQKVENKIQEEDNGLVVVKNSEGLEVKTPVPSTKKTEEIKGEEPKRFIKLCEALPLPTKKTSRVKDDNKGKGKSKKKTSEKETSLSKKKIVKERRLKLKELSSKEKSKTAENLTKVSLVNPCLDNEEVKKAPNCAKITERNRGCFLAETTNLNVSTKVKSDVTMAEKTTKGTKKTKQSSPRKHKEARKPLDGSRKDVREEALSNDGVEKTVPPKSREKKHTRRSKRINGSVESDKTKSDEVNTIDAKKNNNGKKSVQFRDENLVEVREYECEGVLNKIQFKVKDLALKKNDDAVLSLKKYTEGTPVTSMETIYDMCKWNVVWLEECKKVEGEPPVGDLLAVMVNREQFATFQEYQRSFITLQMYELWAATVQDCALKY